MAQMAAIFNINSQIPALEKMSQAAAKLATGNGASRVVQLLFETYV